MSKVAIVKPQDNIIIQAYLRDIAGIFLDLCAVK